MIKNKLMILVMLITVLLLSVTCFAQTEFDLEGREIGILTNVGFYPPIPFAEEGEDSWFDPSSRLQSHIESVENKFNCKINFIETGWDKSAVEDVRKDVLSGDNKISVAKTRYTFHQRLVRDDFLHDLTDILGEEYYDRYPDYPEIYSDPEILQVKGKNYAFAVANPVFYHYLYLKWNMELFEREGLPNLYDLYENDEWTYEAFEEIARKVTKDTTGDGEIDQTAFHHGAWDRFHAEKFPATNNAKLIEIVDGRIEVAVDQPEMATALEFWRSFMTEGEVGGGKEGFHTGKVAMHIAEAVPEDLNLVEDDVGVVPLPKGPDADEYVNPSWRFNTWVVPISEPNPRAVIEIIHALAKDIEPYRDSDKSNKEIARERWSRVAPDRKTIEMGLKMPDYFKFTKGASDLRTAGWVDVAWEMAQDPSISIPARLSEFKPKAQAVIDDIFDQ